MQFRAAEKSLTVGVWSSVQTQAHLREDIQCQQHTLHLNAG